MRKTLITLGILTAVGFLVFFTVGFFSDQVIIDDLTGDALISAVQSKLNYNAVSFIALVVGGISALAFAALFFSGYIAKWSWATKLP